MPEGLSKRQEHFAREYVIDYNGTRAAISAGYSRKGADVRASQLLAITKVSAFVDKLCARKFGKLEVSADHVVHELARLAFYDPRKFFADNGELKPINELDSDTAACLAGLEVSEVFTGSGEDRTLSGYLKKIKLPDKGANLERLGKHLGIFHESPQNVMNVGMLVQIQSQSRAIVAEIMEIQQESEPERIYKELDETPKRIYNDGESK